MKVIIAEYAGFCFGVKRALDIINDLLNIEPEIQVLGELIHNKNVLKNLEKRGVKFIKQNNEINKNEKVVIRTHGIPLNFEKDLRNNGVSLIDATCPLVKKIHRIVSKLDKENTLIVIVGDPNHPEVLASRSYSDKTIVVNSIDDVNKIEKTYRIDVVGQTTLDMRFFKEMISELIEKAEVINIYNTICEATRERQDAVKKLASDVDYVFVIGGKNSSNTKKLYTISKRINDNTYHIQDLDELLELKINFKGNEVIGITAGASTSPDDINKVKEYFEIFNIKKEN